MFSCHKLVKGKDCLSVAYLHRVDLSVGPVCNIDEPCCAGTCLGRDLADRLDQILPVPPFLGNAVPVRVEFSPQADAVARIERIGIGHCHDLRLESFEHLIQNVRSRSHVAPEGIVGVDPLRAVVIALHEVYDLQIEFRSIAERRGADLRVDFLLPAFLAPLIENKRAIVDKDVAGVPDKISVFIGGELFKQKIAAVFARDGNVVYAPVVGGEFGTRIWLETNIQPELVGRYVPRQGNRIGVPEILLEIVVSRLVQQPRAHLLIAFVNVHVHVIVGTRECLVPGVDGYIDPIHHNASGRLGVVCTHPVFFKEGVEIGRSHQDQLAHHKGVVEGLQTLAVSSELVHVGLEFQIVLFRTAVRLEGSFRIREQILVVLIVDAGLCESPKDHVGEQFFFECLPRFGQVTESELVHDPGR